VWLRPWVVPSSTSGEEAHSGDEEKLDVDDDDTAAALVLRGTLRTAVTSDASLVCCD
jgi:hypothetical protein